MITRPGRKVRSDTKLEHLSPAQHKQLICWLDVKNSSYTEAVARVRQEFGVSAGRTAMAAFYQRYVAPAKRDRALLYFRAIPTLSDPRSQPLNLHPSASV